MRSPQEQLRNLAQAILHIRSHRATSRRTLADVMTLSPSTAGFYVDQLIGHGLIQETGVEQVGIGRPKRSLGVKGEAGWFAGVEFNAERVQAVRLDFSGRLIGSELRPLPEGATTAAILKEVRNAVSALKQNAMSPLLGVGVGAPGVVDPERGIGLDYAFVPDWRDVPVVKTLASHFKVAMALDNNLRVIALAERWFGGGRDLDDYVILGPRSGFGIAIMHRGRLFSGCQHAAGEIGRWPWPLGEGSAELHDQLSSVAVWRRLSAATSRSRLPANLHTALAKFADTDSNTRAAVVADYAQIVGCLHLLLDSSAYLLHGPLTALGNRFCDDIVAKVGTLIPMLGKRLPRLLPSRLGDDAGAIGAACLAMELWKPPGTR